MARSAVFRRSYRPPATRRVAPVDAPAIQAAADFTGAGALTVDATAVPGAAAAFAGSGALTIGAPALTHAGAAAFAGAGALAVDAARIQPGAAAFAGAGALSVDARRVQPGAAAFAGTGALNAAANQTHAVAASFAGAGSMQATPGQAANATFAGAGALVVGNPTQQHTGSAAFAGAGGLTVDARRIQPGAAAFAGAGAFAVDGRRAQPVAAAFAGAGALGIAMAQTHTGAAAFVGAGAFAFTPGQIIAATFAGAGALSAAARQTHAVAAALVGAGAMAVGAQSTQRITTTFAGAGALSLDARPVRPGAAILAGAGALSVDGRRQHPASAVLAGSGALSVTATRVVTPSVAYLGSGRLQAEGRASGGGFLNLSIWAVRPSDGVLVPLPHFVKLAPSPVLNGIGSIEVEYPAYGQGADLLRTIVDDDRDLEVEIWLSGRRVNPLRGILSSADGDDTDERATNTYSGAFLEVLLDEVLVWNQPAAEKQELVFSGKNAGTIVTTIVQQIQARGGLAGVTRDFSTTLDSTGGAWSQTVNIKFSPTATLLEVLGELVELGLVDAFQLTAGRVLRLFRPGAFGTDRTVGTSPVVFRRGRNLTEAPRRKSLRKAGTAVLVAGSEGVYQTASNATALARRGRRIEVPGSANNLSDVTAVQAYAQNYLASVVDGEQEISHALPFGPGHPRPLTHFTFGDWIWSDTRGQLARLRVFQWTVVVEGGRTRGELVLNTLRQDALLTLARKLKRISSGAEVVGTSTSTAPDTLAPAAPTGVTADSLAYQDGPDTYATVIVGWTPVTTNADGSATGDVAGYRIEWRTAAAGASGGWQLGADVANASAGSGSFGGVAAGIDVSLRVSAYDRDGNTSAPSTPVVTITTQTDTTAPPTPSTPVCSTLLGVLMAEWDGKGSVGQAMPPDFDYVEVHVSTASNFTPTAATYFDRLYGAGTMPITKESADSASAWYGATRYVRLVAVDRTPLKSGASAQGSATPSPVVSADVFDGAVGSSKLADLAVINAKIGALAVNDAKVGDLSVGKLTAGVFSAALTLSGIFRTGTTGARGEWDSTSFRQYNASGVQTLGFVPGGVSFITGELRTALTGQHMRFNPGGTVPDEVRVYPSGGGDYARINARTAPSDGSAAILIDGGATGSNGRGRLGAYRGEAFISYVTGDPGGDTQSGYSRTAVTCRTSTITLWTQSTIAFQRYSGTTFVDNTNLYIIWKPGTNTDYAPCFTANGPEVNAGIKFDDGIVLATINEGTAFGRLKANGFDSASTAEAKTDIVDLRQVMTPLERIRAARSRAYRYTQDVELQGEEAPIRFGPLAEELPAELVAVTPRADGSGRELSVSLGDQIGTLWGALNEVIDQEIVSTSAVAVLPAGQLATPGIFRPGDTVEVPVSWDSNPPAAPTGGIAQISSAFIWAGKVTAWVKTGSCTATGCVVVFKNISTQTVVVSTTTDATRVVAAVTGLGLYSPPYTPEAA